MKEIIINDSDLIIRNENISKVIYDVPCIKRTLIHPKITSEYTEILGLKVPLMTIPVKPGRNLAVIIEVAAMNNRQKKMGFNAAHELLASLGMDVSAMAPMDIKKDINI